MRSNGTEHAVSTHFCGPGGTVEPVGSGSGAGCAPVVVVTARPRSEKRYTPLVLLVWSSPGSRMPATVTTSSPTMADPPDTAPFISCDQSTSPVSRSRARNVKSVAPMKTTPLAIAAPP